MPDQTPSMPPLPEPRLWVAADLIEDPLNQHDNSILAYQRQQDVHPLDLPAAPLYTAEQVQAVADERVRAAQQWRPIETAPKDGRKVILFYLNRNNKARTVMARWLTDEEAEESDEDGVGLECGWYECIDNWDDFAQVAIHEGEPTHWMPLPPVPTLSLAGSKKPP